MRRGLIVFVKKPVAGSVKTRLTPPLTPEESCDLYACFLEDGLRQYDRVCAKLDCDLLIRYSPAEASAFFQSWVAQTCPSREVTLRPQQGEDLGARMASALEESFQDGYEQLVIIGSDHPTLPDAYILDAFKSLSDEKCDAVIGKAEDGGYYLIGMKQVLDCFDGIPWSTSDVLAKTLARLQDAVVRVLPEWYDVDDLRTLKRCASEIRSAADGALPLRTAQYLEQLDFLKAS